MFKKIVIIMTLILAVGLVFFIKKVNNEEQNQMAQYEEVSEKRRPLLVKQQELEKQLEELAADYEASKLPKGTTQVIFTGLEADVYNVCYPIMQEFEYTGILALSPNQLPGMEGRMTIEQFQELRSKGWQVCVKWDATITGNNWWPALKKTLKELGIETCSTVYFTNGIYKPTMDANLQRMGFSVVVHHGEPGGSLLQLAEEEGLWHLGAVGLMGEKPKLRLTESIAQKGNITYLVGFELEDEKYNERSFRSMLSYFEKYEETSELIVSNIDETRQHYRERLVGQDPAKEEAYNQAKEALEQELAKVQAEIDALDTQEE